MSIEEQLEKFELSNKEAKVYINLLELDSSIVMEISKKTHINRSTTYVLLENLLKKGLVSTTERGGIRYYKAVSPVRLKKNLEDEIVRQQDLLKLADKIIPELEKIKKSQRQSIEAQIYNGEKGILNSIECLKHKSASCIILKEDSKLLEDVKIIQTIKRLSNSGTHFIISSESTLHKLMSIYNKNIKTTIVDEIQSDILISDNHIVLISDQNSAISIQDTRSVNTMRSILLSMIK